MLLLIVFIQNYIFDSKFYKDKREKYLENKSKIEQEIQKNCVDDEENKILVGEGEDLEQPQSANTIHSEKSL